MPAILAPLSGVFTMIAVIVLIDQTIWRPIMLER